jgi:hypothetical protein
MAVIYAGAIAFVEGNKSKTHAARQG